MRWLIVHAHPDPDSFSTALFNAVQRGLERGGGDTRTIELYLLDFRPWMTEDEHRNYETIAGGHPDPQVAEHIELVAWAEGIVFVYPTWWAALPAMLKGWLDRVLLPGVAFVLNDETRKVEAGLTHVRRLVGVTTYGAPRWQVRLLGDGGRTTIGRTIRLMCRRTTRVTWLCLDKLDGRSDDERSTFLDEVENTMAGLR